MGIKGYVDATPVIGYREEGGEDEDKKGVYFIKGDMEIAAQPFLSLAGDIFIELDSPWYSPAPDKIWTWKLGGMEWPLGGSFGVKASVEHILGSKEPPSLEFQEVDFSANKFMTDLLEEKAAPSAKQAAEQAGQWREKNKRVGEKPPTEGAAKQKGGISEGTPPAAATGAPSAVKPSAAPLAPSVGATKKDKDKEALADPSKSGPKGAGKSPKEREEIMKKTQEKKKEVEKQFEKKGPQKKTPMTEEEKKADKQRKESSNVKEHELKWQRGVAAVKQALEYKEKTGISRKELDSILKSIKRRKEYGFIQLYATEERTQYTVYGAMSNHRKIVEVQLTVEKGEYVRTWQEFETFVENYARSKGFISKKEFGEELAAKSKEVQSVNVEGATKILALARETSSSAVPDFINPTTYEIADAKYYHTVLDRFGRQTDLNSYRNESLRRATKTKLVSQILKYQQFQKQLLGDVTPFLKSAPSSRLYLVAPSPQDAWLTEISIINVKWVLIKSSALFNTKA